MPGSSNTHWRPTGRCNDLHPARRDLVVPRSPNTHWRPTGRRDDRPRQATSPAALKQRGTHHAATTRGPSMLLRSLHPARRGTERFSVPARRRAVRRLRRAPETPTFPGWFQGCERTLRSGDSDRWHAAPQPRLPLARAPDLRLPVDAMRSEPRFNYGASATDAVSGAGQNGSATRLRANGSTAPHLAANSARSTTC